VPRAVASELITSDNYVNPEVVQTAEVQ
jgi:hypothetical protein